MLWLGAFGAWLQFGPDAVWANHVVTDLTYVLAAAAGAAACAWAASTRSDGQAGWRWLSAGCVVWLMGALVWAYYELVLARLSPSPSLADVGFVGYALPAVVGLSKLAGADARTFLRTRMWLDGLVISLAIFTMSWLIVLAPVLAGLPDGDWLVRAVSLAYPLADIAIASVVLVQIMRAAPGRRGPWLLLGAGLLVLVGTDTLYVRGAVSGTYYAGGLLDLGWVAAFLLVGLAALSPEPDEDVPVAHRSSLAQESLPFVPVTLAFVIFGVTKPALTMSEPTVWILAALLCVVVGRYVVITSDHLRLAASLEAKVAERTADLSHQAFHDNLTGVPNRHAFINELSRRITGPVDGPQCAVLYIDLDGFKAVNDGLGHTVGDEMLRAVAGRFLGTLRDSDFLARLGGDEFGVITSAQSSTAPERVAQRLLTSLRDPVAVGDRSFTVGASIGIAVSSPVVDSAEEVLRNADLAMYRAKARGGSDYETFDRTVDSTSLALFELETDLKEALQRHEFELHYQPIARLQTGTFAGAEALLRWNHPTLGLLTPDRFLDLAERTGAIVSIGDWVLDEACRELKIWQSAHLNGEPLGVAVNLSARQLGPRLVSAVEVSLRTHRLDAGCLTLELTEGLIQADAAVVSDTVRRLKQLGVWLAIDDFGTGHSSLGRLRDYAFDELKIDRSFVSDLHAGGTPFVSAQIVLAQALGMQVVAEGVETLEQLEVLRQHGCNQVQGYLVGRPVPAEDVRVLLAGQAQVPALSTAAHIYSR